MNMSLLKWGALPPNPRWPGSRMLPAHKYILQQAVWAHVLKKAGVPSPYATKNQPLSSVPKHTTLEPGNLVTYRATNLYILARVVQAL